MKYVMLFGKRGKVCLRYIGLYEILDLVGGVAYHLELPSDMSLVGCFEERYW